MPNRGNALFSIPHPEYKTTYTLHSSLANYAWHGQHHLAHIQQALKYKTIDD